LKVYIISEDGNHKNLLSRVFQTYFNTIEVVMISRSEDAAHEMQGHSPEDFVILDTHLKMENPKTVFQNLRRLSKEFPILAMGEKALTTSFLPENFYEDHSANGVIQLPFDMNQFTSIIKIAVKWLRRKTAEESAKEMTRDDVVAVKIKNFYHFKQVPYNVYLQLNERKLLKLITENETYTEGLIQKYAKRGVKFFFVDKRQHAQHLEHSVESFFKVFSEHNRSLEATFNIQIKCVSFLHEFLRLAGPTDELFKLVDILIEDIENLRPEQDLDIPEYGLLELIALYPFHYKDVSECSLLTAYIALHLVRFMRWDSGFAARKIIMASLIHNMYILNDDLIYVFHSDDPKLDDISSAEKEEFLAHASKAAAMSQLLFIIPKSMDLYLFTMSYRAIKVFPMGQWRKK